MTAARALAPVLALLERGIVSGGDVAEMIDLLRTALGVQGIVADTGWGFGQEPYQHGVPSAWQQDYEDQGLLAHDPAFARLTREPAGTWYWAARDMPTTCLHNPLDVAFRRYFSDAAIVQVEGTPHERIAMVFYREHGAPAFSEEELGLLQLLYPHLRGGLGGIQARRALAAHPDESLDDVIEAANGTAIVSFPACEVTWSTRAKALWRRRLGVTGAGIERVGRMLVRAVMRGRTEERLPGGVRAVFVRLPPEGKASTRVLVLHYTGTPPARAPATAVLAPAEELLSPRQREVARMLAAGASLVEVARALGIRLDTARDHRDEVYRRLGVGTRAELASLLH